jgi:hypothetical protein
MRQSYESQGPLPGPLADSFVFLVIDDRSAEQFSACALSDAVDVARCADHDSACRRSQVSELPHIVSYTSAKPAALLQEKLSANGHAGVSLLRPERSSGSRAQPQSIAE